MLFAYFFKKLYDKNIPINNYKNIKKNLKQKKENFKYYEIKYYTVFEDDIFEKYKVYKISNRSMEELRR